MYLTLTKNRGQKACGRSVFTATFVLEVAASAAQWTSTSGPQSDRKMRPRETLKIASQSAMAKLPYLKIVPLQFVDQRAYGGVIAKICDKGDGVENTWSSTLTETCNTSREPKLVFKYSVKCENFGEANS